MLASVDLTFQSARPKITFLVVWDFFVALISEESMDSGVEKTKGDEGRWVVRSAGPCSSQFLNSW